MFEKCERCGWEDSGPPINLIGGLMARLCLDCQRSFYLLISESHAWTDRIDQRSEGEWCNALAQAGKPTTADHYIELGRRFEATRKEFQAMAIEFIKPITVPEAK